MTTLNQAKDSFEKAAGNTVSATKAEVLRHLEVNPRIRRQLPHNFRFNYRKTQHWLMVAEATEFVKREM